MYFLYNHVIYAHLILKNVRDPRFKIENYNYITIFYEDIV